jgi:cytochrome c oxidase cbb3-type subunit 3
MRGFRTLVAGLVLMGGPLILGHALQASADDASSMATARQNYSDFCARCHGADGKGNGPAAATLNPKPRDYTDCKSMAARSDAELFKVISEGGDAANMSPDMQPWGGTLSDEEIHGLVKFVRSFCKKPAAAAPAKKSD